MQSTSCAKSRPHADFCWDVAACPQAALPASSPSATAQINIVTDLVAAASPHELIRQLIKLSEVLIQELNAARRASSQNVCSKSQGMSFGGCELLNAGCVLASAAAKRCASSATLTTLAQEGAILQCKDSPALKDFRCPVPASVSKRAAKKHDQLSVVTK
eukprot:scaffold173741_cov17-Tisochrysis_lutea.AAC.1